MYYTIPTVSLGAIAPPVPRTDVPAEILDYVVPLAGAAAPIAIGRWLAPDDRKWVGWAAGAAIGIPLALWLSFARSWGGQRGWEIL